METKRTTDKSAQVVIFAKRRKISWRRSPTIMYSLSSSRRFK